MKIILLVLFVMPVVFQFVIGMKSIKGKIKLKFWQVATFSIISQILATVFMLISMTHTLKKSGIKDGLGCVAVEALGVLMIVIILIVIAIQLIIKKKRNKNLR